MLDLYLVLDLSNSMNTMGKPVVAESILQILSSLNELYPELEGISLHTQGWNGTLEGFYSIIQMCNEKYTMILTDGFALYDNCRHDQHCKNYFRTNSNFLSIMLCGADALDISQWDPFKKLQVEYAENILLIVEKILLLNQSNLPLETADDGWE